ncbi:MAG: hypothetical protein DRG78_02345 [Epsilonproteobacteria bacterium]|nr:MAG: hypothetical protein DRG78_02345 [Campylobacterota bacterium]
MIKDLGNNILLDNFQLFYKTDFKKLQLHKDMYRGLIVANKDIYNTIIDTSKYDKSLSDDSYDFLLNILEIDDLNTRIELIKKNIHKFLGYFPAKQLEESIYQKLISYVMHLLNKENITEDCYDEFIKKLNKLFDFDKKVIGLVIRNIVVTNIPKKEKDLQVNSLHFLMTSTSHIQNNLLSPVESQIRYYQKYVEADLNGDVEKKKKILTLIDKNKSVLNDYKEFVQNISTLFSTFKSNETHDNIKNIDFLYFILDLVFTNGVNIKYKNIKLKVTLTNTQDTQNQHTITYENILIGVIYALVENAVEAGAKNISLDIQNNLNSDAMYIFIKNDGKMILPQDSRYIFNEHYTTKEQMGLGLPIVSKWLREMSSTIELASSDENETIFKLTLPLWKTIKLTKEIK